MSNPRDKLSLGLGLHAVGKVSCCFWLWHDASASL